MNLTAVYIRYYSDILQLLPFSTLTSFLTLSAHRTVRPHASLICKAHAENLPLRSPIFYSFICSPSSVV